ncbi:methionine ABC transporter permease [Actinomycetota bacterium]|nr:methionine ABC transporter permease [Actinomycetota bacterium]
MNNKLKEMSLDELLSTVIWPAFLETFYMLICTAILSLLIGMILALILVITSDDGLAPNRAVNRILDFIISTVRSFPFIILVVIMIPVTRLLAGTVLGWQAAVIPLSFALSMFAARLFEASLREVDPALIEAARSFGASRRQIVFSVILPESVALIVKNITVTLIQIIAATAVVGAVGAGGLGSLAINYGYQLFNDRVMYSTVAVIIVLVLGLQYIGDFLYKKLK